MELVKYKLLVRHSDSWALGRTSGGRGMVRSIFKQGSSVALFIYLFIYCSKRDSLVAAISCKWYPIHVAWTYNIGLSCPG